MMMKITKRRKHTTPSRT